MDSIKKRRAMYRMLFKTESGSQVLDDFLAFTCMYHGRYELSSVMPDEEIYIRQQVGRELLQILDLIPSRDGRANPIGFTSKLFGSTEKSRRTRE